MGAPSPRPAEAVPRKVRELKADLRRAGFGQRPGKGSHTVWVHPSVPFARVTLSGKDGDDADRYQEQALRDALKLIQDGDRP